MLSVVALPLEIFLTEASKRQCQMGQLYSTSTPRFVQNATLLLTVPKPRLDLYRIKFGLLLSLQSSWRTRHATVYDRPSHAPKQARGSHQTQQLRNVRPHIHKLYFNLTQASVDHLGSNGTILIYPFPIWLLPLKDSKAADAHIFMRGE